MDARVAVMTGPGAGAIATVQFVGSSAAAVLERIFTPAGGASPEFTTGEILLGSIVDGDRRIDQVTVGCEGPETFAIHCHGNPLIVEQIVTLLGRHGAELVPPERMLAEVFSSQSEDAIAIEAKLALTTVRTIEGARLIANQVEGGLSETVRQWRDRIDSMSLDEVSGQARQVLRDSETARLMISGCTVALIGPPNTGKSILLNTLAGRDKAIVTDVKGTTRDWIHAEIQLPPLAVTLIDTAGLDTDLAGPGGIDRTAQEKTNAILNEADLILLVLDASSPVDQLNDTLLDKLGEKRVLTVLNKSDLPACFDTTALPDYLNDPIQISAKQNQGIDTLLTAISQTLAVADFAPQTPIAFTDRQRCLLDTLSRISSRTEAALIISELPKPPISARSFCMTRKQLMNETTPFFDHFKKVAKYFREQEPRCGKP